MGYQNVDVLAHLIDFYCYKDHEKQTRIMRRVLANRWRYWLERLPEGAESSMNWLVIRAFADHQATIFGEYNLPEE